VRDGDTVLRATEQLNADAAGYYGDTH
jgi:hypothetical protein